MFSRTMNCLYWLKNREKKAAIDDLAEGLQFNNLTALEIFMAKFKYVKDSLFDWTPGESTAFHSMKGDCLTAAVLWNWGFKKLGLESCIYRLKGKPETVRFGWFLWTIRTNHIITVAYDAQTKRTFIGSNDKLKRLSKPDWKLYVMRWVDYYYEAIEKF